MPSTRGIEIIMKKYSYKEAVALFQKAVPTDFPRKPCEEQSSCRMGGWLLNDAEGNYVAFVSNFSGVNYLDLVETTPTQKPQDDGITNQLYAEFKEKHGRKYNG